MPRSSLVALLGLTLVSACATGHLRQVRLGAPAASQAAGVVPSPGMSPADAELARGMVAGLTQASRLRPDGDPASSYQLEVQRLSGRGQPLEFVAMIQAPDAARAFGAVQWRGRASDEVAGHEAGRALGLQLARHARDYAVRRPGDERILFAPTGDTVAPGSFFLTDEEVLLLHFGVGLGERVQLSAWLGGFGLIGGGFAPLAAFGLFTGGAAGLVGVADLGLKVRVVDESRFVPAIALSYDLLDFFGAAVGVGGVLVPGGAGAEAVGAVANAQFNLFSLTASKHLGSTELVLGSYLLDNHHFLPQTARFAATGTGGTTGSVATVAQLPIQVQPFLAVEQVLGPHSALALELFPRLPVTQSVVTTGVRWNLGWPKPLGPLALDRIRFRVELSALWVYLPPQPSETKRPTIPVGMLPFLTLGISVADHA